MSILLAHGGGGVRMRRLVEDLFLPAFGDEELRKLDDSAVLGEIVFTTDAYVVKPLFFPGGNIGKLAVCGTVNDIAVMGAEPLYLSLAMIIEEGFSEEELERVSVSIGNTAKECGVRIVAGDTKVVERGKGDGLYIISAGIGQLKVPHRLSLDTIKPGDKVIINGGIGLHGVAVLIARGELGLSSKVESDCAGLWGLIEPLLSLGVRFMRDATRGGVGGVLTEVADGRDWGIKVFENKLPVPMEVKGVCEVLGFEPLYLANEGKVCVVVENGKEEDVLASMRSHPLGKDAVVIGEVVEDYPGKVVVETSFGTHRILEPPMGELLPRIC